MHVNCVCLSAELPAQATQPQLRHRSRGSKRAPVLLKLQGAVYSEGIFTHVLSYFEGTVPECNLILNSDNFILDNPEASHLGFITCKPK